MKKLLNINTLLICLVLVAGIGGLWYMKSSKTVGTRAVVSIDGEEEKEYIDLNVDKVYTIDAKLVVTLEVKDGKIAFINSRCPDKLCEGFGHISHEGEMAVCLPGGVAVTIDEGK
ncbi:MAG: NusG domain II-containing protein [Oscillospiraceae bacterium]